MTNNLAFYAKNLLSNEHKKLKSNKVFLKMNV